MDLKKLVVPSIANFGSRLLLLSSCFLRLFGRFVCQFIATFIALDCPNIWFQL